VVAGDGICKDVSWTWTDRPKLSRVKINANPDTEPTPTLTPTATSTPNASHHHNPCDNLHITWAALSLAAFERARVRPTHTLAWQRHGVDSAPYTHTSTNTIYR